MLRILQDDGFARSCTYSDGHCECCVVGGERRRGSLGMLLARSRGIEVRSQRARFPEAPVSRDPVLQHVHVANIRYCDIEHDWECTCKCRVVTVYYQQYSEPANHVVC